MDRHNEKYKSARIDLAPTVPWVLRLILSDWNEGQQGKDRTPFRLLPVLGRLGFLSGGIAVIATASLLAMHIN